MDVSTWVKVTSLYFLPLRAFSMSLLLQTRGRIVRKTHQSKRSREGDSRDGTSDRSSDRRHLRTVRFETVGERIAKITTVQNERLVALLDQVGSDLVPAERAGACHQERLSLRGVQDLSKHPKTVAEYLGEGGRGVGDGRVCVSGQDGIGHLDGSGNDQQPEKQQGRRKGRWWWSAPSDLPNVLPVTCQEESSTALTCGHSERASRGLVSLGVPEEAGKARGKRLACLKEEDMVVRRRAAAVRKMESGVRVRSDAGDLIRTLWSMY